MKGVISRAGLSLVCCIFMLWGLFAVMTTSSQAVQADYFIQDYEPTTIIYWHQHTGIRGEKIDEFIAEFNAGNPYSITVIGEYTGSYGMIYDQIIAGLQENGPLPNLVAAYGNQLAEYASYGRVKFLDDYFDDPIVGISDPGDFYTGTVENYRLNQYGDQLSGLQPGISIDLMYYNADLLSDQGLGVPTTWNEFETACISITTDTISGTIPSVDASRFATWLWSRGGELLSVDAGEVRFNEQPGIDSLLFFQELIDDGYARLPNEAYEDQVSFGNGETGFTFGSSAGIPYYRVAMEAGANNSWGVTHVPAVPGYEVVNLYGAGVGIIQHTDVQDLAAWQFIKWLTEADQTARWAAASGYFPIRLSAGAHISITTKLAEDPQYAQAYDLLPLGRSEPGIRGYEIVRDHIKNAMVEILENGGNVTDTLNIAATEANDLLASIGPSSAAIPPTGGNLVYTTTSGSVTTIEFPAASVALTETFTYIPLDNLPTDGLAFALIPSITFLQPVTITISFDESDLAGMEEEILNLYLYDWASKMWVNAEPCGGYTLDTENNIFQAQVCHFSDYALIDYPAHVFLPYLIKNQ